MRASELFGLHVFDRDGREIGTVHDVRLRREPFGDAGERLRIDGFVVGPGAVGLRLGYGHGETKGPWIVKQVFRRRTLHTRFVPWSTVARRSARELHVDVRVTDLPSAREL